ncbi:hypothetical protein L1274_002618 [Duganella sp. HSC-15S17]|uniref:Uncharacterized protein n=1 Tax=Duganella violaceipulchra TaxID=2849652 RepID=A0ABT1GJ50_9BURK|nr:hypothetical protein [Duganella violaceicalia]
MQFIDQFKQDALVIIDDDMALQMFRKSQVYLATVG